MFLEFPDRIVCLDTYFLYGKLIFYHVIVISQVRKSTPLQKFFYYPTTLTIKDLINGYYNKLPTHSI